MVRKARVIVDDNSHVLAKHYELLPSGRRFRELKSNTVFCSAVNSISEQINLFKRQSSARERTCARARVRACVRVCVCKLRKLLDY